MSLRMSRFQKWIPTRKWFAALVAGSTPIVLQAIDEGWHTAESKQGVVLLSALLLAYIVPSDVSLPAAVVRRSK